MLSMDYKQEYEEFWKDIVENADGTLNKDKVMRELSDYSMVIDNCTRAYDLLSDGAISKPNTMFYEVESIFNEKYVSKDSYDAYGCKEDIEEILESNDLDEIKNAIRDYFEISQKE